MAERSNACTVSVLGCVLEQLYGLRRETVEVNRIDSFYCEVVPIMPISCYVARLAQYSECNDTVLILALIYVNRVTRIHTDYAINVYNIHRLYLSALLCAEKFYNDWLVLEINYCFAQIGGVSLNELNALEIKFLFLLDFKLCVDFATFASFTINWAVPRRTGLAFARI